MESYLKTTLLPWGLPKPSVNLLLTAIQEKEINLLFSFMIQEATGYLKVPHEVTLTALSIFTKFYYKRSFQEYNPLQSFSSLLYLACKIEDEQRRHRDIINVTFYIENRMLNKPQRILDITTSDYAKRKNTCVFLETIILKELGFTLYQMSNHAHSYLLYFVAVLTNESKIVLFRRVNV